MRKGNLVYVSYVNVLIFYGEKWMRGRQKERERERLMAEEKK